MSTEGEWVEDRTVENLDNHLVWLDIQRSQATDPERIAMLDKSIESLAIALTYQVGHQISFRGAGPDHPNDAHVKRGTIMVAPSGIEFDFREPRTKMIQVRDMAHHLARIHRFGGASDGTVAQHLVAGCQFFDEPLYKKAWFMHDAEEYVMGDMAAPLKALIGPGEYRRIADRIREVIFRKFALPSSWAYLLPKPVKAIDTMMLEWERRDQMPGADWMVKQALPELPPYTAWSRVTAEENYLRKFQELWPNWSI